MNIIYETIAGSQLYGTSLPTSDTDYRGVCLQPIESLLGLRGFDQIEQKIPDRTIFGVRKFLTLAADCNPNIVEILFAPLEGPTVVIVTPIWEEIVKQRHLFISKAARHRFIGYAHSQFGRMATHHEWMNKPPEDVKPEDYGAHQDPKGQYVWPNGFVKNEYHNKHNIWVNYQTWLKNRNPTRHALEAKWGYDTKYGMHLIRLVEEGMELLTTGKITLPRPNAEFLLKIRNEGVYSYDDMRDYLDKAEGLMAEMETASSLPYSADDEAIEQLLMKINYNTIKDYYHG